MLPMTPGLAWCRHYRDAVGISLARNCSSSESEVAFAGELEELVAKYQERSMRISGTGRGAHSALQQPLFCFAKRAIRWCM